MASPVKPKELSRPREPLKKDQELLKSFVVRGTDAKILAENDPAMKTVIAFLTESSFTPEHVCEYDILRGSPPKKS